MRCEWQMEVMVVSLPYRAYDGESRVQEAHIVG